MPKNQLLNVLNKLRTLDDEKIRDETIIFNQDSNYIDFMSELKKLLGLPRNDLVKMFETTLITPYDMGKLSHLIGQYPQDFSPDKGFDTKVFTDFITLFNARILAKIISPIASKISHSKLVKIHKQLSENNQLAKFNATYDEILNGSKQEESGKDEIESQQDDEEIHVESHEIKEVSIEDILQMTGFSAKWQEIPEIYFAISKCQKRYQEDFDLMLKCFDLINELLNVASTVYKEIPPSYHQEFVQYTQTNSNKISKNELDLITKTEKVAIHLLSKLPTLKNPLEAIKNHAMDLQKQLAKPFIFNKIYSFFTPKTIEISLFAATSNIESMYEGYMKLQRQIGKAY